MKGLRIPTNMKNKPPSWLILECRYSQVPVLSSAPILPHRLLFLIPHNLYLEMSQPFHPSSQPSQTLVLPYLN